MPDLYLNCPAGLSGDMFLGALVDLGLPIEFLQERLGALGVEPPIRLRSERVMRAGIAATKVHVDVEEDPGKHRHLRHVRAIIDAGPYDDETKRRANAVFLRIAEAEAKVHGSTAEKIHFHEVGALDAVADVLGTVLGLRELGVERVRASRVVVGSGTVECQHGTMPVPAPATAEILRGVPIEAGPIAKEMTTPTGAALLMEFAEAFAPMDGFAIQRVGYGAGSRSFEKFANVVHAYLGLFEADEAAADVAREEDAAPFDIDFVTEYVCEIDDMTPEQIGDLMQRLMEAGALDAHATPVLMKKGRPGFSLRVLVRDAEEEESRLEALILRESSTLGLRVYDTARSVLRRERRTVRLTGLAGAAGGAADVEIDVKVAYWGEAALKAAPEYESCRRAAQATGLPLRELMSRAEEAIRRDILGG